MAALGPTRIIAVLALGSGATVLAAASVGAAPPPPADTSAVCANVPDGYGDFDDVGGTDNEDNIECLAYAGVTAGTPDGGFDPGGTVSRAQMATFIARGLDTIADLDNGTATLHHLPPSGPDAFTDDDGVDPHEASINRLAAVGIVSGSRTSTFDPDTPVNRAQMATFINNAHEFLTDSTFSSAEDFFTDDDGLQPHEENINAIAAAGIAQGVSASEYGPTNPVSRNQMASFLIRYLAVLHGQGVIDALPVDTGTGRVDGTLAALGETCTWTSGTTSAAPPATSTIDVDSINPPGGNLDCTGDVALTIHGDPTVTFDDAAGTATADVLEGTVASGGVSCRYRDTNLAAQRQGTTRTYAGTASGDLVSGDDLCPPTLDIEATVSFRA